MQIYLGSVSSLVVTVSVCASVFTTLLVCGAPGYLDVDADDTLSSTIYGSEVNSTKSGFLLWDEIQSNYECCGVSGDEGYDQWRDYLDNPYPDSCCTFKYPGCGEQARATLSSDFANTFSDRMFTTGCLTVLRYLHEESIGNCNNEEKYLFQ